MNLSETTFVLPSRRRPRACGSSRRGSRCRSPVTRRSAPRTSCARCAAGDARHARDERRASSRSGATATCGRCAPMRRATRAVDSIARRARGDARPREADDAGGAAVGRHRRRAARDPARLASTRCARAAPSAGAAAAHGSNASATRRMAYVWARRRTDRRARAVLLPQARRGDRGPGTGSACANLGGWLLATGAPLPVARSSSARARRRPALPARSRGDGRTARSASRGGVIEIGRGTIELL